MRHLPGLLAGLLCIAGCAGRGPVPARLEDLVDGRWHWVAGFAGGAFTARPDPSRHWFETGRGGAIIVQADCNSGVGRRPDIDGMRLGPIGLTRRFCGDGSLDTAFAGALAGVTDASLDAGLLRLTSGASTLLFTRAPDARLQRYLCPSGPVDVLWSARTAWLVAPDRSGALERAEPREPVRYSGPGAALEREGDAMTLVEPATGARSRCPPAGTP